MVRKTIQLTETQSEALERHAKEQGTSFSEAVRRAADVFLKDQPVMDEVRLRAIAAVGYASSGDTDVSVRHDDYLAEAHSQ